MSEDRPWKNRLMDHHARVAGMDPDVRRLMRAKPAAEVTPMQELFVREYLVDLNATQAWIRAGGEPASATRSVARLMKQGHPVKNMIDRAIAERSARVGLSADRVIREFARIAFGDPRVLFNDDGSLRAHGEYDPDDAVMIEGIKTRRIVEINPETGKMAQAEIQEVKLASKISALNALGRHLGMFTDKVDVNVTTPLDQRFAEAMAARYGQKQIDDEPVDEHGNIIDAEYEEVESEDVQWARKLLD